MEDFQNKFIEEAIDLLYDLEKAVLSLEDDSKNLILIQQVFGIMHSLKGSGGMFGFDKISNFTHHLESIYDLIRTHQLNISKEIISLTFRSVDILRNILKDPLLENQKNKDIYEKTLNEILILFNQTKINKIKKEIEIPEILNKKTYYIYIKPKLDILNNGTNPIYLLEDLSSLGEMKTFLNPEKLPNLKDIEIFNSYFFWHIFLTTEDTINNIKDVFIFVEDEIDLELIEIENFFYDKKDDFFKKISELDLNKKINSYIFKSIFESFNSNIEKIKLVETKEIKTINNLDTNKKTSQNNISSVRVSFDRLDNLMNLVSELVTTQAGLSLLTKSKKIPQLNNFSENIEILTKQLRDLVFDISLVTIDSLFIRFRRLVRDLADEYDKEIQLIIDGEDTELDSSLIQNLYEPLMHIIRNAVGHGIETKEIRKNNKKNEKGKIHLKSYYSGTYVYIVIKDDGKGIDVKEIEKKAIEKKLIKKGEKLNEKDILDFIFLSNFSTAKKLTDISGRGVGLDVVKKKINEIKGEIEINTILGKETTFTIKVPLTISIIDGLLVNVNKTKFVIPLSNVIKIFKIDKEALKSNFSSTLVLDGKQIPFINLRKIFNIEENLPETYRVILVRYEENKNIAIVVDFIIGEHQTVLKPIGKYFKEQDFISATSIMGDGKVALVLDINKLIDKFKV